MKDAIQNHIGSLNWGYRVALREKTVSYVNAYAEFVNEHTIKVWRLINVKDSKKDVELRWIVTEYRLHVYGIIGSIYQANKHIVLHKLSSWMFTNNLIDA